MDLLFKRYASPFVLLDNMIATGRFCEFVCELIEITNEEEVYDIWIRRVFDKGFNDFKNSILEKIKNDNGNQNVETTVMESMNILNNFKPE